MRIAFACLLASILFACNHENTTDAPTGDSGAACSQAPNIECPVVAPSPTTCTGGENENGVSLPLDASFSPGCQAYFRGADCSSQGFCTCDPEDDAGNPAHWNCHDTDGGT
jgi:hypothetical protein